MIRPTIAYLIASCLLFNYGVAEEKRKTVAHLSSPHLQAWADALEEMKLKELEQIILNPQSDKAVVRSWIFALTRLPEKKRDFQWLFNLYQNKKCPKHAKPKLKYILGNWVEPKHQKMIEEHFRTHRQVEDLEILSNQPGPNSLIFLYTVWQGQSQYKKELEAWMKAVMTPDCKAFLLQELKHIKADNITLIHQLCQQLWRQLDPLANNQNVSTTTWIDRLSKKHSSELTPLVASEEKRFAKLKAADTPEANEKRTKPVVKKLPDILTEAEMLKEALGWGFTKSQFKNHREKVLDLFSKNEKRRARSLLKFRELKSKNLVEVYSHFLEDPAKRVIEAAIDNLTILVEEDYNLKKSFSKRKNVIAQVRKLLKEGNSRIKISSIQFLTLISDKSSYPGIIALGKDEDQGVLRSVMDAVAQKEMRNATDTIGMWLNDPRWEVRARAARIYFEIYVSNDQEKQLLENALEKEKDPYVKNEIKSALTKVKSGSSYNKSSTIKIQSDLKVINRRLKSDDPKAIDNNTENIITIEEVLNNEISKQKELEERLSKAKLSDIIELENDALDTESDVLKLQWLKKAQMYRIRPRKDVLVNFIQSNHKELRAEALKEYKKYRD